MTNQPEARQESVRVLCEMMRRDACDDVPQRSYSWYAEHIEAALAREAAPIVIGGRELTPAEREYAKTLRPTPPRTPEAEAFEAACRAASQLRIGCDEEGTPYKDYDPDGEFDRKQDDAYRALIAKEAERG